MGKCFPTPLRYQGNVGIENKNIRRKGILK